MPKPCKICSKPCFNTYGICATCSFNAPTDQFDKLMGKATEYEPVIPPYEAKNTKAARSGFPKPNGPATAINANGAESMEASDSGGFDNYNKTQHLPVINKLIEKYGQAGDFFVSPEEASTKKDHIVTYEYKSNRIDRQGPESSYKNDVVYAVYAIQIGKLTVGGIHMQSGKAFSPEHLVKAFEKSLETGKYTRVFYSNQKK
jgi:hypothetical protein